MEKLVIKNLHVAVEGNVILNGVNLTLNAGETIALVGPNGHGKSTLLQVIMGHPRYRVLEGSITLDGKDILAMSVDERSRAGLFLGMQYPSEVPGVINADFFKAAINAKRKEKGEKLLSAMELFHILHNATKELNVSVDLANRSLNEGFSGGEKKRNEILQMMLLEEDVNMLDEIDSGLDVDALQDVAKQIVALQEKGKAFIIISHYPRLFELVHPSRVVVMMNGVVAIEGGKEIIDKIDEKGYEVLALEYGVKLEKRDEAMKNVSIEFCPGNGSF